MVQTKPMRGRGRRRRLPIIRDCSFCKTKTEPDYKEPDVLRRFMTDRGKIVVRTRNGSCAKHQRRLTRQIKRARFLALLPFLTGKK
jgi:small subunit ribosomal protein S18